MIVSENIFSAVFEECRLADILCKNDIYSVFLSTRNYMGLVYADIELINGGDSENGAPPFDGQR